jgi:hypothetical protein
VNYTLPEAEDKENQQIYMKTFEKGLRDLPKFMRFYPSTSTYQISTSTETKPGNYLIEVHLSDTFAQENLYTFTVKVMPKKDSKDKIIHNIKDEVDSVPSRTSNTKEKKKVEVNGTI